LILLETTFGGRGEAGWRCEAGPGRAGPGVSSSRRHSTDGRQWLYRFPHLSALEAGGRQRLGALARPARALVAETDTTPLVRAVLLVLLVVDCRYQISDNEIRQRASGVTDRRRDAVLTENDRDTEMR